MKLFLTSQIRLLDQYTIEHEPIASIDLMERAADVLLQAIINQFPERNTKFIVFAGPGNNGGDALALTRKLKELDYEVEAHLYHYGKLAKDCSINKERLQTLYSSVIYEHISTVFFPEISASTVIIDGLFGSGLNRPLTDFYTDIVGSINNQNNQVVAIDVPSGLNSDTCNAEANPIVRADYTFSFQFPKLAFFYAENEAYMGRWSVLDIQLHPKGINQEKTDFYFLQKKNLLLHQRKRFSHKGTYGHLALLAGSKGMSGAAILSAQAAQRSGVGLVTVYGEEDNRAIIQSAVPEAMYIADLSEASISYLKKNDKITALAVGPGIGQSDETVQLLLEDLKKPLVMDADALNIMAKKPDLWEQIPPNSIITPHPKEFVRLFGKTDNSEKMLKKAQEKAIEHQIIIVLKGAHTRIITSEGKVLFNSTGNAGMATGGSGDVLTGIIGSLLAQNYQAEEAAKIAVYLHGLAADLALETETKESMIAGDIIKNIGKAFNALNVEPFNR